MAVGLLSMGLAVPLLQGKVGRNALYGVRFRQSFQSDEAWFAINRYGAQRMMIWALPMIAIGIAVLFLPLQTRPFWALLLGFLPLAFVLIPAIDTWHYARRYSSDRCSAIFIRSLVWTRDRTGISHRGTVRKKHQGHEEHQGRKRESVLRSIARLIRQYDLRRWHEGARVLSDSAVVSPV